MLSKLKNFANKIKQRNKEAKEIQSDENDGLKKTIKQIKYFISGIGILMPIAGVTLIVIVSLMMLAGPVMLLGQFINGAIDSIKEFGTSVGNFFTSGCYGTDEECLQKELQKREVNFVDSIKEVFNVYISNIGGGMTNRLDKYEGTLIDNDNYSVSLNTGLLVSALNYMDETEENYFQLQQEQLACSRLIKKGFLDEDNNRCNNQGTDGDAVLKWYFQPETDNPEWNEKLADQIAIDSDAIWAKVTGITESQPCGNYNDVYNDEDHTGVVYYTGENLWGKFVNWITGNDESNQLRMLAKNLVERTVSSSCENVPICTCPNNESSCDESAKTCKYEKKITNAVYYNTNKEHFKDYLIEEYVPALMLEDFLFYQIDIMRTDYEKEFLDGKKISTKSEEKAYLSYIEEPLAKKVEEYLSTTDTERYKKQVKDHAERIIDMASEFDEFDMNGQYLNDITFYQGENGFKGEIMYFNQTYYPNNNYGSYGTIASHGCGPTSLAIAMSSLLGQAIDPVTVTNWACSNGYCTSGGSYWSLIVDGPAHWGLKSEQVGKDAASVQKVVDALASGDAFVVAIMGPGHFTRGGHFITLAGVNDQRQALVYDPASRNRTNQYFDLNMIVEENNGAFWIIRRN